MIPHASDARAPAINFCQPLLPTSIVSAKDTFIHSAKNAAAYNVANIARSIEKNLFKPIRTALKSRQKQKGGISASIMIS